MQNYSCWDIEQHVKQISQQYTVANELQGYVNQLAIVELRNTSTIGSGAKNLQSSLRALLLAGGKWNNL